MQTLRHAFSRLQDDPTLGTMVQKALRQPSPSKKRQQRARVNRLRLYLGNLQSTKQKGLGSLAPASFLDLRPGSAILYRGCTGTLLWGLESSQSRCAVVLLDAPQPLAGTTKTVRQLLVNVQQLQPCDCGGNQHSRCR